jgi:hypothetical protein
MKLRRLVLATLAVAALPFASAAIAAEAPGTSRLALSALGLDLEPVAIAQPTTPVAADVTVTTGPEAPAPQVLGMSRGTVLESVRWKPRRRYRDRDRDRDDDIRRSSRVSGMSQIHGGFYDPDGEREAGFLVGFRGSGGVDEHVQLGLGLDWIHKSERNTALVTGVPIPGGGTSERRIELARSSSNLFPIMAFAQFSPGNFDEVMPYFGIAGGYEVLFLSAEDFETGEEFDGTYGGWGWQVWGGLAFPLGSKSRLAVEVFRNDADVERDVDDPTTGETYREIVDVDGLGMRFGLNWGF